MSGGFDWETTRKFFGLLMLGAIIGGAGLGLVIGTVYGMVRML